MIERSYSTLSPSATSQIFSPVAGLKVGNVFPLTEFTHTLLIKSCEENKFKQMSYYSTRIIQTLPT